MNIRVQNHAGLSNKYVRFAKWKIYRLGRKFKHLKYAEVFLSCEGNAPKRYRVNVRLGIAGNDIIIKNESENLAAMFRAMHQNAHRYLARYKETRLAAAM